MESKRQPNREWSVLGRKLVAGSCLVLAMLLPARAQPSKEIVFRKHTLDLGRNETCSAADLNGDGRLDIVAGENWYEAPEWTKHRFRSFPTWSNYIDNFTDLALDVDGDGAVDIVSSAWSARRIAWFKNPGKSSGPWKETVIDSGAPVEFSFLVDLDNDGEAKELLPQFGGGKNNGTAWYEVHGQGHEARWVKHAVSAESYGHGIGAGDVNGDGRADILTPQGWLEAPSDPRRTPWLWRGEYTAGKATGFLYVHDVDGDGKNDIVSSMAHDYGVFWLRQETDASGKRSWAKQTIDDAWSQAHAMTMVDLTGNGRLDLVTGKRLFAHNGHDPGGHETLGLYWYEYVRTGGKWEWVRHIVHYGGHVGGGMQIPVVDIDRDGDLDIAVAGKGGVFLFENQTKPPPGR